MNQIPKLRFRNSDGTDFPVWEEKVLGSCVAEFREKSKTSNQYTVLTSSRKGLIPQNEYYGENNRITDRDNKGFNIIPNDHLTYRSRSDDGKFHFNLNSTGENGVISTYYPVFKNKMGSNLYLLHLLNTNWRKLYKYSVGTSQKVLSFNELKSIKFLFPIEAEQQKIADFFESVDEWIENLQKQKEAVEAYKKGITQKIFSQLIHFKDDSGKDFPKWSVMKLGNIATFSKGKGLSKSAIKKNGSNKCIHYGELYTKYHGLIREIGSKTNISTTNSVLSEVNDVLMPTSDVTPNGLAKASALNEAGVILGGDILIIRSKKINNLFFSYYVEANKRDVMRLVNGATVYHLYGKDMSTMKVLLPAIEEQQKVSNFLSSIDSLIQAKDSQITNAKLWKKGLLQQMFV